MLKRIDDIIMQLTALQGELSSQRKQQVDLELLNELVIDVCEAYHRCALTPNKANQMNYSHAYFVLQDFITTGGCYE